MRAASSYTFKKAATREEFADIHRLNHRTFVDEVGQHEATGTGALVDPFHARNTYFIAKRGESVVGMIAVHGEPPFSVASKLADASVLEEYGTGLLEARLLAIPPEERNGRVFAGLLYAVLEYASGAEYTHVAISGVGKHLGLYERIGFRAIGPAVERGQAEFTPMVLRLSDLPGVTVDRFRKWAVGIRPICLLPGPVQVSAGVQKAFALPAISHRSHRFVEEFEDIRAQLRELAGGLRAGLFPGSGTLANDVAGAAIAADRTRHTGLILANGEFGYRLVRHAKRWRLPHRVLAWEWGQRWDMNAIAACLEARREIDWIWAVQLETSTGMVNDTATLVEMARGQGAEVYLDCVSSFGAMETDLSGAALATTVSGKSLGGYSGAAIVMAREDVAERWEAESFPPSLDLAAALRTQGPLMTFSSPVIRGLHAALQEQGPAKWTEYRELGEFVRAELRAAGLRTIVEGADAAPVITTFEAESELSRCACLRRCVTAGFTIAGESDYLKERNWLQIATMGEVRRSELAPLFGVLGERKRGTRLVRQGEYA
jgi:aspartate aminotransferase-like enzyme/predicted N-acetyltransferase YhbS